jgi:hypothetical protein
MERGFALIASTLCNLKGIEKSMSDFMPHFKHLDKKPEDEEPIGIHEMFAFLNAVRKK